MLTIPNSPMNLKGQETRKVTLNLLQLYIALAYQRFLMVRAGRGAGKSVAMALKINNVLHDMPRSKNFILNESFQFALTNTLPSTIQGLDFLGLKRDVHYTFGRYPEKKRNWPAPYDPPMDPKRAFFFYNGTVYDLLSQKSSTRGPNYCSGIGEEALLLDPIKIKKETMATLRGQWHRFGKSGNHPTYGQLSFFTSTPRTRAGEWIYEWQELARKDPKKYLFLEAPSRVNSFNLPTDYFSEQKRMMSPAEYDIEIENLRPKGIEGGFYPFFDSRRHCYNDYNDSHLESLIGENYQVDNFTNLDCRQDFKSFANMGQDPNASMEISVDYGSWFNGVVTGQEQLDINRYLVLSSISYDEKKQTEDVAIAWCDYYRWHPTKHVYYYYDSTAIGTDGRTTETYFDIWMKTLRSRGWEVTSVYLGKVPAYQERYDFFGKVHRGIAPGVPTVEYHKHNCKWLIISMENAGVKQGKNGFEKDKTDEQYHEIDQRTTTHFSDAHDNLIFGKYYKQMSKGTSMAAPRLGSRR
ncbi:MAG TPA: hypothetical protein VGB63_13085 [Pedobacter sp.]